jgi:hypothetical protein
LPEFDDIPDPVGSLGVRAAPRPPALNGEALQRSATRNRRVAALMLSVSWLAAHLTVYGLRADLASLPPLYIAVEIALPFALAAASLAVALGVGRLGLGLSIAALSALAILGPLSFWLMAAGAPLPRVPEANSDSWLGAFVCMDITLAWAGVPILCAALSLRRAFPVAAGFRSALVGAACGLFAGAVMNLHCANVDRFHMLLGHAVPVLVAVLVGAFVLRRTARA